MCKLVDREAEAANNDRRYTKALGFLRRVVKHLFQCSHVGVRHKVS